MYTLVIIDDEESILEQLSEIFDWPQLGFELVGSFSSVQEFLEFNEAQSFDVLLTDIRLGKYSGLDIGKTAKQKNSELEVILISAYSEFDFAKEAISMKVFEYLLKPITYQSVTECFGLLRERLDKKTAQKNDRVENEKKMNLVFRRQLMFDFMAGMSNQAADLQMALKNSGVSSALLNKIFFQIVGELEPVPEERQNILTKYGREAFCYAIDNLCADRSIDSPKDTLMLLPSYISNTRIIAFIIADETLCTDDGLQDFLEKLAGDMKELLKLSVSFTIGKRTSDPMDPGLKFKNRSIIYENICELSHQIRTKLTENNKEAAFLLLRWGFEDYASNLPTAIAFSKKLVHELGDTPVRGHEKEVSLANAIQAASSVERVYTYMQEYLTSLMFVYQSSESSLYQVELAKQYIAKNYMKDICLNDVADYVSLSPVYFSRYFKKNTGERFMDYLCKIRIEQSVELLKDPQNKAYEICALVGYKSKKHFYKLFKLYTGYTPIEYRNQSTGALLQKQGKTGEKET